MHTRLCHTISVLTACIIVGHILSAVSGISLDIGGSEFISPCRCYATSTRPIQDDHTVSNNYIKALGTLPLAGHSHISRKNSSTQKFKNSNLIRNAKTLQPRLTASFICLRDRLRSLVQQKHVDICSVV